MPDTRTGNRLLDALPTAEFCRLSPHWKAITMNSGDVLHTEGERIHHVYFPVRGMISLVTTVPSDEGTEVGTIGTEGMAGLPIVLGVENASRLALCQIPGRALRLPSEFLLAEFKKGGQLQKFLLRYIHILMAQITQTAACNRHHQTDRRLARWLLNCADRTERNELPLTHEFLSQMLGVGRSGVSIAANTLQSVGLISYKRGDITIVDRPGLEEYSCPCQRAVAVEYESFINLLKHATSARDATA